MTRAELWDEAREFRRAVELFLSENKEENLSTNFGALIPPPFPHDCCKSMSYMFAQHLINAGKAIATDIVYLWGQRQSADGGSPETHGWLQIGDFYVDLTGDQFGDGEGPIVVKRPDDCGMLLSFGKPSEYPYQLRHDHDIHARLDVMERAGLIRSESR